MDDCTGILFLLILTYKIRKVIYNICITRIDMRSFYFNHFIIYLQSNRIISSF